MSKQTGDTPDPDHMSTHSTKKMAQSPSTSNVAVVRHHQDPFQELFNTATLDKIAFRDPGPEHWQPLTVAETRDNLIKHLHSRPLDTDKVDRYMNMFAEGPSFTEVIHTAIHVHRSERRNKFPDCFDIRGKLRVPWLYILPEAIKNARMASKDTPKATTSKTSKSASQARRSQDEISEGSRSSSPQLSTEFLCRNCQLRPIADDGESDTLCSDCAKRPRKKKQAVQAYSKQNNNKRLKMSDNPVPETPQPSSRIIQNLPPIRGTGALNPTESSQKPDPLSFSGGKHTKSQQQQDRDASTRVKLKFKSKIISSPFPESQNTPIPPTSTESTATMVTPTKNTSVKPPGRDSLCIACGRLVCVCSQAQFSPLPVRSLGPQPIENGQNSSAVIAAISITDSPLHGQDWLDHVEEICQPLDRLNGLLSSYSTAALGQSFRVSFLDIACVRNEGPNKHLLVGVLRSLLEIHEGVSIRAHLESLSVEMEYSFWVKAVMMFLIKNFVFESGSPFEDTAILRRSLSYSGISSEVVDMIIQDTRIRTMRAKAELQAPNFFQRKRARHDAFMKKLNEVMHPLVSSSNDINSYHAETAEIASALNININAYTGVYKPIYPARGVKFDSKLHDIDRPEFEGPNFNPKHLEGKPILLTIVVGVVYKTAGRDWVVVSKAKVRLWQPVSQASPERSLPSIKRGIDQITIDD